MKKIAVYIKSFIKIIGKPSFWVHLPKNTVVYTKKASVVTVLFLSFFVLLIMYFIDVIFKFFESLPIAGRLFRKLRVIWKKTGGRYTPRLVNFMEKLRPFEVKRSYLIYLAFENLRVKKSRSLVTIAGMSFGVGVIVLLLSLGYGIERLVISRVASLQDLKVIDVSTGGNTAVRLTRDAIQKFEKLAKVQQSIPFVSIVGRITFNKATTDVLVYSAPNEYFSFINAKLEKGVFFKNNSLTLGSGKGEVAGASTEYLPARFGESMNGSRASFNINPGETASVWDTCSTGGTLLGFTARIDGGYSGTEIWGSEYYPFEDEGKAGYDEKQKQYLGKWIKGTVALYMRGPDDVLRPEFDEHGVQKWVDGCIRMKYVQVQKRYALREVLGISTTAGNVLAETDSTISSASDSGSIASAVAADVAAGISDATDSASFAYDANVIGSNSAGLELVDLTSQDQQKKAETKTISFKGGNSGEAIVSTGLLSLLGISPSNALSSTFNTSFIIGKSQIPELDGKAQSQTADYKIVGVIDDPDTQYFYIPLSDVENLGISNFSQAKIVLAFQDQMSKARKQIEDIGFRTASTADTVTQIESLFANLRILLGLLGMVALGVASLGMFNTLTVSLLERTREIGGMKTIGMVTDEVQELLLSEAMIMGLSGGIGGLILGYLAGFFLSSLISIYSIANGGGYISLTYIPPFLIIFILVSSFIVGVITGLYPAMRARKVSALNALRYE